MRWIAQVVYHELASPSEVNHLLWCLDSLEAKPGHACGSVRCHWRALSLLCPHYALSSCMMPAGFSLSLMCRSWWWCRGTQACNQEMLWLIKNLESLGQSIITPLHLWKESEMLITQSCPTLWDPMDCNPSGSSAYGILQARILEWIAIPFSRGYSWPRDRTHISCSPCMAGKFFITSATREGSTIIYQWQLLLKPSTEVTSYYFWLEQPNVRIGANLCISTAFEFGRSCIT